MYKLTDLYKQIKEESTETSQSQYKIYCDMDGVLTNFDEHFKFLNTNKLSPDQYKSKYGIEKFWNFIDIDNKLKFWTEMKWMPDGKELWDAIKDKNPTILSAPSKSPSSRLGKRLWIKNNIPGTPLILASAESKKNYARKDAILIDDRISNINDWNNAGGIGILHTSTSSTLNKLSKYGL
jgi:hypothetical protein